MAMEFTPRRQPEPKQSPVASSKLSKLHLAYESNVHVKETPHQEIQSYVRSPYSNSPRTPRRDNSDSSKRDSSKFEYGSMPKSRNKTRPKNVMISPATSKKIQNVSPRDLTQSAGFPSSSLRTPTANTAYAGPTFHSSPAPSTLPIPRFYSESLPDSPNFNTRRSSKESHTFPKSPKAIQLTDRSSDEDSPLDYIFKMDRERKKFIKNTPTHTKVPVPAPFCYQATSPCSTKDLSYITEINNTCPKGPSKNSSITKLLIEAVKECDSSIPYDAPFSTPYSERIKAIRPLDNSKPKSELQPTKNQSRSDITEALKAYLFSGHLNPTNSSISSGTSESC
ncbi:hypothetical protein GcC1_059005 [Golovinomyces cichoracearum]|uniref:Uncharacterized protein n=1 Tax=Golovinomyces cichoracearum TaxID=62708 RepID=A0A420ITR5_9PEZI|nr:hypothetical protein GcC1_059005 [Golovinomyces cichoracearum]